MALREIIAANCGDATDRTLIPPLVFMLRWEIVASHAAQVKLEDVADFWGDSVRSAYRDQARFRRAFPGERNPEFLLAACRYRERHTGWRGLAEMKVRVNA
jgi:hypothetical protein